jgi:DNA-binding PadR family transcriptional regulator
MRADTRFWNYTKTKIVNDLMQMIILSRLKNVPSSANDITVSIRQETGLPISLGVVYSTLYFLERQGFVKGKSTSNERLYFATPEGVDYLEQTLNGRDEIVSFIKNILKGSNST